MLRAKEWTIGQTSSQCLCELHTQPAHAHWRASSSALFVINTFTSKCNAAKVGIKSKTYVGGVFKFSRCLFVVALVCKMAAFELIYQFTGIRYILFKCWWGRGEGRINTELRFQIFFLIVNRNDLSDFYSHWFKMQIKIDFLPVQLMLLKQCHNKQEKHLEVSVTHTFSSTASRQHARIQNTHWYMNVSFIPF